MSLSALLLGGEPLAKKSKKSKGKEKAVIIDDSLDALFKSSSSLAPQATPGGAAAAAQVSKRKRKAATENAETPPVLVSKKIRSEGVAEAIKTMAIDGDEGEVASSNKKKKSKSTSKASVGPDTHDSNTGTSKASSSKVKDTSTRGIRSDEDEDDVAALVHESVSGKIGSSKKLKFVPESETSEIRDQRTIFIGNLPLEVAKNRPMQKQLKRHILSFVPSAKIESMRFRSLAFQKPTTKLPTSDDESSKPGKSGRIHDRDRAASWRENQDTAGDDAALRKDQKKFLRPEEKKKIAFIKGELHSSATTANAYVVFAYATPGSSHTPAPQDEGDSEDTESSNDEVTPLTLVQSDPFEATRSAVSLANGSTFLERTIRVDYVKAPSTTATSNDSDPKRTVFVGNLDFASKEEDLRAFFEGVVSSEIGPPPAAEPSTDVTGSVPPRWVTRVRIVRDKDTQLGKGFAYVQFRDTSCVDEVVAMDETKLKFAKRKLRVQRCKTIPGSAKVMATPVARPSNAPTPSHALSSTLKIRGGKALLTSRMPMTVSVPKGDPSLGTRLANLTKEERKQAKSSDADRLARRAAKKKAKTALMKAALKGGDKDARVRKRPGGAKSFGSARKEVKKRVMTKRK